MAKKVAIMAGMCSLHAFHHSCGGAGSEAAGRYVGGHGAVGCYDGTVADGHARHDAHVVAYPHSVAYGYLALGDERSLPWRN
jgi:hypothetical protein